MKIWILEDEPPAVAKLCGQLARIRPDIEVERTLGSVEECLVAFDREPMPDLVMADIELRDGRVFDVFAGRHSLPPIIFTTAYDAFMLDAFATQGIAYLLKPFGDEQLDGALKKFGSLRGASSTDLAAQLKRLAEAVSRREGGWRRRVLLRQHEEIGVLAVERICGIRLEPRGIAVFDVGGGRHSSAEGDSLVALEENLDPAHFFRINRTEIVRLDAIVRISPRKGNLALALKGQEDLWIVSAHRTARFRAWLIRPA